MLTTARSPALGRRAAKKSFDTRCQVVVDKKMTLANKLSRNHAAF